MAFNENRLLCRNVAASPLGGIRMSAFVKDGKGVLTSTRILTRYTLVFVVRGEGLFIDADGNQSKIRESDGILVLPGEEHWYGPEDGGTWDEIFIEFEGPVFDLWREQNYLRTRVPVFELKPSDYWMTRFIDAAGESHARDPDKMLAETIRLQSLLADIHAARRKDVVDDLQWLEAAKHALGEHPDRASDAAAALGVSYEVFRKRFKKLMGVPPGRYQIARTMEAACDLLLDKSITIREIAGRLGYCDEYHFSKQFRKTIGWPPSEYRSRISKN